MSIYYIFFLFLFAFHSVGIQAGPIEERLGFSVRLLGGRNALQNPLLERRIPYTQIRSFQVRMKEVADTHHVEMQNKKIEQECRQRIKKGIFFGIAGLSFCCLCQLLPYLNK